jgi:hypothetical protein
MSRLCGLSHWARSALGPTTGGRTAELPIINPSIVDNSIIDGYDISPNTPLSKGFCPSWSCAFFFPSIICQHHLNRLTKLLKHNNSNQQTNHSHQSTCLPTSDPAAPTRPVTSAPSATPRSRPSRRPTPVRSCAMHRLQRRKQDADIGHRGRAFHCQPARA